MADVDITIRANDQTAGVFDRIGQSMGRILETAAGFVAAQVFTRLGDQIADFMGGAISSASDFNETLNKTGVIFSENLVEMQDWANDAAQLVGLSKTAALDAAAGFGMFAQAAGLAGDDVMVFSQDLVGLSADLASFYNTSVPEAATAIQALFRGETEPIRRYNVMIDDASMRQKALELGIVSTTKQALTPQQKILAANAVLWEQTAKAQGDFANTSDGFANSQRIFAAQIENAQIQLGTVFLPVVTQVMAVLNTQFIPILGQMIDAFALFYAGLQQGNPALDAILLELTPLMAVLQSIGAELMTIFQPAIDATMETFNSLASQILPWLLVKIAELSRWFIDNRPLIEQFAQTLADGWINIILPAIQVAWDTIRPIIDGLMSILGQLAVFVMQVVTGDMAGAFSTLQTIFMTAANAIGQGFVNMMEGVARMMGTSLAQIGAMWANNWNLFVSIVGKIAEMIRAKVSEFVQAGAAVVQGLFDGIRNKANELLEYVRALANQIADAFTGVLGIQSPSKVFEQFGQNITAGLAIGITDNQGAAVGASTSMASAMVPGAAAPMSAAPAAAGVVVNLTFAPGISLGTRQEAAEILLPFIRDGVRDVIAGR